MSTLLSAKSHGIFLPFCRKNPSKSINFSKKPPQINPAGHPSSPAGKSEAPRQTRGCCSDESRLRASERGGRGAFRLWYKGPPAAFLSTFRRWKVDERPAAKCCGADSFGPLPGKVVRSELLPTTPCLPCVRGGAERMRSGGVVGLAQETVACNRKPVPLRHPQPLSQGLRPCQLPFSIAGVSAETPGGTAKRAARDLTGGTMFLP